MESAYTLDDFNQSLAERIKQTDNFDNGVQLYPKDVALTHKYIQFNDLFIKFMVLDLDRENSAMDWELLGLPSPNIVVQNRLNGRCHYIYALEVPICNTKNARFKPISYFKRYNGLILISQEQINTMLVYSLKIQTQILENICI